ncbi:hypothetical protein F441_12552 [Phytophthora nicotianae CJ01A1]|uniref:Uncharacterized protein n=1 Tax=Phytophthora nicotianae CJ01A1 TaxID=1317063 RepID=W2WPC2_PHYNI|nr:hypothetical protein F441_12552 [Phytophthora nicotianae CJ01A1]
MAYWKTKVLSRRCYNLTLSQRDVLETMVVGMLKSDLNRVISSAISHATLHARNNNRMRHYDFPGSSLAEETITPTQQVDTQGALKVLHRLKVTS